MGRLQQSPKTLLVPHQFILSAALQDLVSREEKKSIQVTGE